MSLQSLERIEPKLCCRCDGCCRDLHMLFDHGEVLLETQCPSTLSSMVESKISCVRCAEGGRKRSIGSNGSDSAFGGISVLDLAAHGSSFRDHWAGIILHSAIRSWVILQLLDLFNSPFACQSRVKCESIVSEPDHLANRFFHTLYRRGVSLQ